MLSLDEATNCNYDFSSDISRRAKGSDYAKCQGLWVSKSSYYAENSIWLLRSPGYDSSICCRINDDGYVYLGYDSVHMSLFGVRPALKLDLKSLHTHSYTSSVTKQPTHTEYGETTFTCTCGDTYIEPIAKLIEHIYTSSTVVPSCNKNGFIDYTCICGDSYTETLPATGHTFSGSTCTACGYDRSDDCSCNCHKTGITHFFFIIVNFFQKFFGQNKVCACGVAH